MHLVEEVNFWSSLKFIWNTKFKKKKKDKVGRGSLAQTLNALLHILTVSHVKDKHRITEVDYVNTLLLFATVTVLATLTTSATLYVNLFMMQDILKALEALEYAAFYAAIIAASTSILLAKGLNFLAGCFGDYTRGMMRKDFQDYITTKSSETSITVEVKENQQAFFESIESVTAHIPAMLKFISFTIAYAVYAVFHLNPSLLIVTFLIGVCAQVTNKLASKWLEKATSEKKDAKQSAKTDRQTMLEMQDKIEGINAQAVQKEIIREAINTNFLHDFRASVLMRLQQFLAKTTELLSQIVFYAYFATVIFSGYMSFVDVVALLPFIAEIGECAACLFVVPMMSSTVKADVANLVYVWNKIVPDKRVEEDFRPMKISNWHNIAYSLLMAIICLIVQPWVSALYYRGSVILIFGFLLNANLFPKSTGAQLFCYLMKMLEHPVRNLWKKNKPVEQKRKADGFVLNEELQRFKYAEEIFTDKEAVQVEAPNGKGKTMLFGRILPGKIAGVEAKFPADKSLHITSDTKLLPYNQPVTGETVTYARSLAHTFGLTEQRLLGFVQELVNRHKTMGDLVELANNPEEDNRLSTGQKEILYVMAGICKAVDNAYEYVCLDEALGGVHSSNPGNGEDRCQDVYNFVIQACREKNIQLVIIHHRLNLSVKKVTAEDRENNNVFFKFAN